MNIRLSLRFTTFCNSLSQREQEKFEESGPQNTSCVRQYVATVGLSTWMRSTSIQFEPISRCESIARVGKLSEFCELVLNSLEPIRNFFTRINTYFHLVTPSIQSFLFCFFFRADQTHGIALHCILFRIVWLVIFTLIYVGSACLLY